MTDMVRHPPHYNSHLSGIECIEITRHMNFNLGNAFKYLFRRKFKGNEVQDMEKAIWYVKDEIRTYTDRLGREQWAVYPGNSRYIVSTHGNVRRIGEKRKNRKLVPNKKGYLTVVMVINGRHCLRYAHRMVAETYLGPCPAGREVSHIDGDRANNWFVNLKYETRRDNLKRRVTHGTDYRGEKNPAAKLTSFQVDTIRMRLGSGAGSGELAKQYKVSRSTIERIRDGSCWGQPALEPLPESVRSVISSESALYLAFELLWRVGTTDSRDLKLLEHVIGSIEGEIEQQKGNE